MRYQSGFTLLEVMVAFLVLAIGLLGVMGLQNTAIRNNTDTTSLMQAVLLSKEMADLVRANPEAMSTRAYNNVIGTNIPACATDTGCTPNEMAQYDKWLWDARVVESIAPGATGIVCVDSTPGDGESAASPDCDDTGDGWAVKIWWNDGTNVADYDTKDQVLTTADLLFLEATPQVPSYYISFMP